MDELGSNGLHSTCDGGCGARVANGGQGKDEFVGRDKRCIIKGPRRTRVRRCSRWRSACHITYVPKGLCGVGALG